MNPLAQILSQTRIQKILTDILDVRIQNQNLRWSARVPLQDNVPDQEIILRESGRVTIADIVADDSQAVVRQPETLTLETTKIPNIKHGRVFGQEQLHAILRILNGNPSAWDTRSLDQYLVQQLDKLTLGCRMRQEALICAMVTDSWTYDKLGIRASGVTFGTPSDLKVTPGTPWTNAGSATPIDDILAVKQLASDKYGIEYDRISLSSAAFRLMIATTEYQNKAKAQPLPWASLTANMPSANNTQFHQSQVGLILGMTVEIDDRQHQTEAVDGTVGTARYIPVNTVILSSSGLDGDTGVWDFANGVVTESVVGQLSGSMVGSFAQPQSGPVGYVTTPPDLNPPNVTLWAVQRGFPRRHQRAATAILQNVYTP